MMTAAILAGGRATRFGGLAKGSLLVDGLTIFDRQVAELSRIADEILVVGDATPRPGIRGVADRVPDCGPLGGVHTALTESRGDATLVIACDMPYVTAELLAHLASLHLEGDVVVPRTDRGYHPLCAVYTRACLDPIERRLATGRWKMTGLLTDVRVRVVTREEMGAFGDPDRLLANVNTPADYSHLEALHNQEL